MQKKAFILGIGGQDGFLISELLIKKNYLVYGFYKNNIKTYNKKIKYIKFDLNKFTNFTKYLKKYNPLEIYNFSSISTIEETEKKIIENDQVNSRAVFYLMNKIFLYNKKIKFFHALSSKIFRKKKKINKINEKSEFEATDAYSIAKLNTYFYLKYFREKYKCKFYSAFLFNHNSYYSYNKFFPKKIWHELMLLKKNKIKIINVKEIDSFRDWSSALDVVRNIHRLIKKKPDDYVLGSEKLYSVRKFIETAAINVGYEIYWKKISSNLYGIDRKTKKKIIKVNSSKNNKNNKYVYADCKKFKRKIGKLNNMSFKSFTRDILYNKNFN